MDDYRRSMCLSTADFKGLGAVRGYRFHRLSGHLLLSLYWGEFPGQAAAKKCVRWAVFFRRRRGIAGFCHRYSLLSYRLYFVASVGWYTFWFNVAAAFLDNRTLGWHIPHASAHCFRDSGLV